VNHTWVNVCSEQSIESAPLFVKASAATTPGVINYRAGLF
jgi:hypothetical protein